MDAALPAELDRWRVGIDADAVWDLRSEMLHRRALPAPDVEQALAGPVAHDAAEEAVVGGEGDAEDPLVHRARDCGDFANDSPDLSHGAEFM
jgi:hypothetical protein